MNRLAELRKQKKISQVELGKIIGVAQNTLCNWENGNREIDNNSLIKLAKYFDVSTDYLLGRDEEKLTPPLVILCRNAKKLTLEQQEMLLNVARDIFKEDFDE